jgi:hypothetical protein
MPLPVRKTALHPPLQAAEKHPGVIYLHNQYIYEEGRQWAGFAQHRLTAHITYRQHGWRVLVVKAGRTRYSRHHPVYVAALAALQDELQKAGAEPGSTHLLH